MSFAVPFGIVSGTAPPVSPGAMAIEVSDIVIPDLDTASGFPAQAPLAPLDAEVRAALITLAPQFRASLWPVNNDPVAPPIPPSFNNRGMFRLRSLPQWVDLPVGGNFGGNGLPDNFDAYWKKPTDAEDHLIISEVCFSNTVTPNDQAD